MESSNACQENTANKETADETFQTKEERPVTVGTVDETPEQHGITLELAQLFTERYLSPDAQPIVNKYHYWPVANFGYGYSSVRKVLEIQYTDKLSGENGTCTFVVKVPGGYMEGNERLQEIREMGLFEREAVTYRHVLEASRKIASDHSKEADLPFPKFVFGTFYKNATMLDDYDLPLGDQNFLREKIVIEKLHDFEPIDMTEHLDLEHLELMIPVVARFHAAGYAIHKKYPTHAERLRQIGPLKPSKSFQHADERLRPVCAVLRFKGMTKEADALGRLITREAFVKMHDTMHSEDHEVIAVVHGDLWHGNAMFKYETDETGKRCPVAAKLVDMQGTQFGDPTFDLVFLLVSSTKREARRHIRKLLTWYVRSFRAQLDALGLDADTIAPWLCVDRLHKMYSEGFKHYFLRGLQVSQVLSCSPEDRAEFLGATTEELIAETARKHTEKWEGGGCSPDMINMITGFAEDMYEFGMI